MTICRVLWVLPESHPKGVYTPGSEFFVYIRVQSLLGVIIEFCLPQNPNAQNSLTWDFVTFLILGKGAGGSLSCHSRTLTACLLWAQPSWAERNNKRACGFYLFCFSPLRFLSNWTSLLHGSFCRGILLSGSSSQNQSHDRNGEKINCVEEKNPWEPRAA